MNGEESPKEFSRIYIKNIFKIIFISSVIISLAIIITAFLGYNNTKKSLIDKAKSQDIVFMVKSMASKVDGRISRAVETSRIFARDPLNIEWVKGEEKNTETGKLVLSKLKSIVTSYDYNYFFIAGVKTKRYYFKEKSDKADVNYITMSPNNPDDSWFYKMLESKRELSLNVDNSSVTGEPFLFVNTIMGEREKPVGITGAALSLNNITKEFKKFKIGSKSNLWMVDGKGVIKLSDTRKDIGKKLKGFLPRHVIKRIANKTGEIKVSQYSDSNNEIVDYAYCKLNSSDWTLFYEIPRKESLSLIDSLRFNTTITVILVLIFFMILYYFISRKIANPYRQAMLINMELENKVALRTQELKESNDKIKDSIKYAKRLQESILPLSEEIEKVFADNFIIWRPRDIVGGDFFWLREIDDVIVLAVGDCTGHGVPGALMTMTVNAILHNIVTTVNKYDPSMILRELHVQLKQALNKNSNSESVDDGLDIALFCIKKGSSLSYCGANMELYLKREDEVKIFKPQTRGVGYDYINLNESLSNEVITVEEGDIFIVNTDGFIHQNGGPKDYPFGKKRFCDIIQRSQASDLGSMRTEFENALQEYMNKEQQRDDITVFAFKL